MCQPTKIFKYQEKKWAVNTQIFKYKDKINYSNSKKTVGSVTQHVQISRCVLTQIFLLKFIVTIIMYGRRLNNAQTGMDRCFLGLSVFCC